MSHPVGYWSAHGRVFTRACSVTIYKGRCPRNGGLVMPHKGAEKHTIGLPICAEFTQVSVAVSCPYIRDILL